MLSSSLLSLLCLPINGVKSTFFQFYYGILFGISHLLPSFNTCRSSRCLLQAMIGFHDGALSQSQHVCHDRRSLIVEQFILWLWYCHRADRQYTVCVNFCSSFLICSTCPNPGLNLNRLGNGPALPAPTPLHSASALEGPMSPEAMWFPSPLASN